MKKMTRMIAGPFGLEDRKLQCIALGWTIFLTLCTQVGGVILWPCWSLYFSLFTQDSWWIRWTKRYCVIFLVYTMSALFILPIVAEKAGRKRLPLYATQALPLGPQNIMYPLLNRTYVRTHAYDVLLRGVRRAVKKEPDMVVRYLDAGFPFPYIHLLPHLSHIDGQRIDIAFQFQKEGRYVDSARSPIGYWGYAKESKKRKECEGVTGKYGIPLRWDFAWLQPLLSDVDLDVRKNRVLFSSLAQEKQLCSILLEPTLHRLLKAPKLLANRCSVARHDDHAHLTIRRSCKTK